MSNSIQQLRSIISNNPSLIWYTNNHDTLSKNIIVESILTSGTWQQVQQVQQILGSQTFKKTFQDLTSHKRSNLRPATQHYFSHYFATHAQ